MGAETCFLLGVPFSAAAWCQPSASSGPDLDEAYQASSRKDECSLGTESLQWLIILGCPLSRKLLKRHFCSKKREKGFDWGLNLKNKTQNSNIKLFKFYI